jgi:hypothetical protein
MDINLQSQTAKGYPSVNCETVRFEFVRLSFLKLPWLCSRDEVNLVPEEI